jgi:hypothetical protein
MEPVATSQEIDVSAYVAVDVADVATELNAALGTTLNKTLTDLLQEHPPDLSFPIRWGDRDGMEPPGPPVTDPATLYLRLPFDAGADGECVWQISLVDILGYDFLDPEDNDAYVDGSYKPSEQALLLARRLRELADWLERGPPESALERWRRLYYG